MGKITKYLNQLIVGNVFDSTEALEAYSVSSSALKIKPKLVAFPESTEDIQKLMRFFTGLSQKDIKVPIAIRSSGLDQSGANLTNGVVISTEKLNQLLEIDPRERLVRVQAGITLKELNTALSVSGLTIPIHGADGQTIGGLISNHLIDDYAAKYGGIKKYVERIEVILANGDCLQTERLKKYSLAKAAAEKSLTGEIYRKISKLTKTEEKLLKDLRNEYQNFAGYPGITDVEKNETIDLSPLFFGAQGTLGVISEVILKAVPLPKKPARVVATFRDLDLAIKYLDIVKKLDPQKLNLYDLKIIMKARESGKNLDGVIKKLQDGFVVFASFSDSQNHNLKKIKALSENYPRSVKFIFESLETQLILNEFENSLANYLNYIKDGERVPILTDFYLPNYSIENFLEDLKILSKKLDLSLELFGSYTNSVYSLRPKFNLKDADFSKKAATFLKAGAYIIHRQGGVLTGGSPEGRLKAVVSNTELPEAEQKLYAKIKQIFDKNDVLGADIKLGASSKFTLTHFRDSNQPKIVI